MTDINADASKADPAPVQTPTESVKTFTQDELNDIISKEKAKITARYEQKAQEQAKKEAEAQELARLDGEAKLRKEWEIKERELQERAQKAEHDLAVSNARASLASKGYTDVADIAPLLIGSTAEETDAMVSKFDQMVQKLVADRVAGSLAKGAPKDPAAGSPVSDPDMAALRKAIGL